MADRTALIAQYAAGYDVVLDALAGVTPDELDRRPAPDAWTAREIVHHLADSETNSYIRLRKLLTEGADALVQGYDEAAWASTPTLRYDRPIESSLAVLRAVRASSHELLTGLGDDTFAIAGRHTEHAGPYSLALWLEIYARHAHDHADQIRHARRGEA